MLRIARGQFAAASFRTPMLVTHPRVHSLPRSTSTRHRPPSRLCQKVLPRSIQRKQRLAWRPYLTWIAVPIPICSGARPCLHHVPVCFPAPYPMAAPASTTSNAGAVLCALWHRLQHARGSAHQRLAGHVVRVTIVQHNSTARPCQYRARGLGDRGRAKPSSRPERMRATRAEHRYNARQGYAALVQLRLFIARPMRRRPRAQLVAGTKALIARLAWSA